MFDNNKQAESPIIRKALCNSAHSKRGNEKQNKSCNSPEYSRMPPQIIGYIVQQKSVAGF